MSQLLEQDDQKFFRVICGDVGHDFRTCTERACSLQVALYAFPDDAYLCRHVPSDGPENIENAHDI